MREGNCPPVPLAPDPATPPPEHSLRPTLLDGSEGPSVGTHDAAQPSLLRPARVSWRTRTGSQAAGTHLFRLSRSRFRACDAGAPGCGQVSQPLHTPLAARAVPAACPRCRRLSDRDGDIWPPDAVPRMSESVRSRRRLITPRGPVWTRGAGFCMSCGNAHAIARF